MQRDIPTATSDQLLAELEESIPQGVPNDTGFRRRAEDIDPIDAGLVELDQLLQESIDVVEAKRQYKADRKAQATGFVGMTKEEVEFCNSRMRAFELARVWQADATIAVFRRYTCDTCGKVNTVFHQYMEHHSHRHDRTAHRWVKVLESKFPPEPVVEEIDVPCCPACAKREYDLDLRGMKPLHEVIGA